MNKRISIFLLIISTGLFIGQSAAQEKPGFLSKLKDMVTGTSHDETVTTNAAANSSIAQTANHKAKKFNRVQRWDVVIDLLTKHATEPELLAWAEKNKERAQVKHTRKHAPGYVKKHKARRKAATEKVVTKEPRSVEEAETPKRTKVRKNTVVKTRKANAARKMATKRRASERDVA